PNKSIGNIEAYCDLIVMDLDKEGDNLLRYISVLKADQYIYAAWISPSGDGIKFLIHTSCGVEAHKEVYLAAVEYYKNTYDIPIDTSGSDVSRLCYVSFDPNLYTNFEALTFNQREQVKLIKVEQSVVKSQADPVTIHLDKQYQKNDYSKKEQLKK